MRRPTENGAKFGTFYYFLLHLQKKVIKEKESGKDNRIRFVRPLHTALTRHQTKCGSHLFRVASRIWR
jgi:hypothetical protein